MLVLTRMVGERLVIGSEIVVQVARVDGLDVQLGIEAPRSIPVLREEVAERSARSAGEWVGRATPRPHKVSGRER